MKSNAAAQLRRDALHVAERLHALSSSDQLDPEQRVLLRAILEADNAPAGEILDSGRSRTLDELFASLRRRGEKRAFLRLVRI